MEKRRTMLFKRRQADDVYGVDDGCYLRKACDAVSRASGSAQRGVTVL